MRGKHSLRFVILASVVSLSLSAWPAFGAPGGKDRKSQGHGKGKHDTRGVIVLDRDGHVRGVREYYSTQGLPPGLAKRQSLPPGLRKQLRERGQLPPGLQKRLTLLPSPLAIRLPPIPSYYTRYFAGRDLIVVDRHTNRIVMLVPDIL